MKQITIILLMMLSSCSLTDDDTEKKSIIVFTNQNDTIIVNNKRTVLSMSADEFNLIKSFRKPLQDAAIYLFLNKDKIELTRHHFKCGHYSFWIANDYYFFTIEEPFEIKFTNFEKDYFWKLYQGILMNRRTFYWENEINVVIIK